jgi:hypothetical protein
MNMTPFADPVLTHQDEAGPGQPFAVAGVHGVGAGDDAAARKVGPQEARRMLA